MARLTYNQIAQFLTQAYQQSTGASATLAALPFATLQQVFSTAQANGEDNLYGYLETVIARTLFAVRPISEELQSLEWDPQRYGDVVRKLSPITTEPEENKEWQIPEELAKAAASQDFACCTAPVRQDFLAVRIHGGNTYSRKFTTFRNQMNAAFHSQGEVESFFSMLATERVNRMTLDRLNEKRALVNNAILAILGEAEKQTTAFKPGQVFYALDEYNAETGLSLTEATVMQPGNFREFMIWLSARIDNLRRMMADSNHLYHADVTGKPVRRHTPAGMQRLYLSSRFKGYFDANKAGVYNPGELPELAAREAVTYWQNPNDPLKINGTYKAISTTGAELTGDAAETPTVIGILFDDDFMGLTPIDTWSAPEPYNSRYGFQNVWYHATYRSTVDFTENAIVIAMSKGA